MKHIKTYKLHEAKAEKIVKKMLDLPYEKFVKELKDKIKNPKVLAVLDRGLKDGNENDEKITVKKSTMMAKSLRPTQGEIDLDETKGKLEGKDVKDTIKGKKMFSDNPIIIANGKYIIDGHHKWARAYMLNPEASLAVVDITLPGLTPIDILKTIQIAIAGEFGVIKTKESLKQADVFSFSSDEMKKWVSNKLGENILKDASKSFGEKLKETIWIITSNLMDLQGLKMENAPGREFMPQPKVAAKHVGRDKDKAVDDLIGKLKSGKVNFKDPI